MTTALYLRVSTQEQNEHGYSIKAQEDKLRSYASAKSLNDIQVYNDGGYSGSNMNRPALTKLLRDVENGEVDTILIYKLDRLSRSQKDTLYMIEELFIKHDTALISLSESFDTSTAFGRAMVGILSVFAQLERENFRERSRLGMIQRAKEGKWCGFGYKGTMFGYDYVNGELVVNEYEAMLVKKIYELYIDGYGVAKIYKYLNKHYPNVINSTNGVKNVLERVVYTGKTQYLNEVYEGNHEAIISEETYNQVQAMKKSRNNKSKSDVVYMLTGVLQCGCCGYKAQGTVSSSKYKDKVYTRRYYKCNTNKRNNVLGKKERCELKSIRKEKLEAYVIERLKGLDIDFEIQNIQDEQNEKVIIEGQLEQLEKQSEKLLSLYIEDAISKKILDSKMSEINKSIETLKNTKIEDNSHKVEMLKGFKNTDLDNATDQEKQNIINVMIDTIVITNEKVKLNFNF